MDVLELNKKLVSIPSYVDGEVNEVKVADFIFSYLSDFDFLELEKQDVRDGRFNVLAKTPGEVKVLFAAHMDTVVPKRGGKRDPLEPGVEDGKLFGLGALDTKGCIAAMLSIVPELEESKGVGFLFYCGEEYDFAGMKKFLKDPRGMIGELAVVGEPSHLTVMHAHRGICQFDFVVRGETGHAARPHKGNSANDAVMRILLDLKENLNDYTHEHMGTPSMNVAYIRGGHFVGEDESGVLLGEELNNIPDYAEVRLDVRTTTDDLDFDEIKGILENLADKEGVEIEHFNAHCDLNAMFVEEHELEKVEEAFKGAGVKPEYVDPSERGFGDGQFIRERFAIPVVYIGPEGDYMHSPKEYVEVDSLQKTADIYREIVNICAE